MRFKGLSNLILQGNSLVEGLARKDSYENGIIEMTEEGKLLLGRRFSTLVGILLAPYQGRIRGVR